MTNYKHITFIGAGNMATAIVTGLVNQGYPADHICVSDPSLSQGARLNEKFGVAYTYNNLDAIKAAEVIVLAVKPQIMATVCQQLAISPELDKKLFISLAAGITIQRYFEWINPLIHLIRVMPNTPALIGKGISGLYADIQVSAEEKNYCTWLMQHVGEIMWLTSERQINDIIAVTGSSPAYFFLLMEIMQQKALQLGFDINAARFLVEHAATGATALVAANPHLSLKDLREQVTSKGGTTAEALKVFYEHQFTAIVEQAMQAAITRAEEMEVLF